MLRKIILLLVIFSCISCLSTKTGTITDDYDEFTGKRTITVFLNLSDAFHQSELRFHYNVNTKNCFSTFYIWDTNWLFINKIYFLIDKQKEQFVVKDYKRNIHIDGDITETVYFESSLDFIIKLSNANNINMKVSGEERSKEYVINDSHKKAINNFLIKINNL